MENNETVTINGNEYTREQISNVIDNIRKVVKKVIQNIAFFYKKLIKAYKQRTGAVGYKRYVKMEQLKKYELISEGKSNNWRKAHGLPVLRVIK